MVSMMMHVLFVSVLVFVCQASVPIDHRDVKEIGKPDPNLMLCAKIGMAIEQCIIATDFPYCNGTKSQLQQCADIYVPEVPKCKQKLIANAVKQIPEMYKVIDDVLCKDNLYKQFVHDQYCWKLAKPQLMVLSRLSKGIFTTDGCRIAKLNIDIIIGFGDLYQGCPEKLKALLEPIFKKSGCGSVKDDNDF